MGMTRIHADGRRDEWLDEWPSRRSVVPAEACTEVGADSEAEDEHAASRVAWIVVSVLAFIGYASGVFS